MTADRQNQAKVKSDVLAEQDAKCGQICSELASSLHPDQYRAMLNAQEKGASIIKMLIIFIIK
jgi:hypothetical protein